MLVQLEDMQVAEKDQTYANLNNTFSVNRIFKSCTDDATIIMRNSGFSDFKAQSIPNNKGTITAVVGKYNSDFQLFIRDTRDIDFTENRCDPLFEENFSSNTLDQWTVQNIIGEENWEIATFGNPAPSIKISGYFNGAQENENWLLSKAIDVSEVTGAILTFETVKRFSGNDLEVYYSTNYNGENPNAEENIWIPLSPILDTNTNSWSSWTSSGNLDISQGTGDNLYIAFKYTSTNSQAATFEIDNVKVIAN